MQESGLTEIIPLICASAIWGQYPVFSHPEFPQGLPLKGVDTVWWLLDGRYYFPSSLSAHQLTTSSGGIADDWDILCLLMWQEIFHSSDPWHLLTLPMTLVGPCIQCLQGLQGLFSACHPFFPSQTERFLLQSAFRQLSCTSSGFKPIYLSRNIYWQMPAAPLRRLPLARRQCSVSLMRRSQE